MQGWRFDVGDRHHERGEVFVLRRLSSVVGGREGRCRNRDPHQRDGRSLGPHSSVECPGLAHGVHLFAEAAHVPRRDRLFDCGSPCWRPMRWRQRFRRCGRRTATPRHHQREPCQCATINRVSGSFSWTLLSRRRYVTVKVLWLVVFPWLVSTVIGPVVAVVGTVTTILVAETERPLAGTPLKYTWLGPSRLTPLMVTVAPRRATRGFESGDLRRDRRGYTSDLADVEFGEPESPVGSGGDVLRIHHRLRCSW